MEAVLYNPEFARKIVKHCGRYRVSGPMTEVYHLIGGFKVHDLEKAKEIANAIIWIGNYFDKWKKGNFIRAMISVMNDKSFVWSIFKRRVENFSAKLTNQGSRDDFIIMIERLYNFKTSPDKRIRLKIYGKRS